MASPRVAAVADLPKRNHLHWSIAAMQSATVTATATDLNRNIIVVKLDYAEVTHEMW